jgi:hypothetical protein
VDEDLSRAAQPSDAETAAGLESLPAHPEPESPPGRTEGRERPQGMLPARARRRTKVERASMRILATGGIIGIDVILGAVLVSQDVAGWIVGLVIGLTSVILAALLWSSRQL